MCVINCTHELSSVCACVCACDYKCLRNSVLTFMYSSLIIFKNFYTVATSHLQILFTCQEAIFNNHMHNCYQNKKIKNSHFLCKSTLRCYL